MCVSIHARHYWRAKLESALVIDEIKASFNPRPSLLAGETLLPVCGSFVGVVSIHARHYWRAKLLSSKVGGCEKKFQSTPVITGGRNPTINQTARHLEQFQSTPVITGGRNLICASHPPGRFSFQSTPVITGGRNTSASAPTESRGRFNPRPSLLAGETTTALPCVFCGACFNPRPSLLAGETEGAKRWWCWHKVSIHARHYWRAKHGGDYLICKAVQFQSTPVITGGRNDGHPIFTHIPCLFQSTPVITGGRNAGWAARQG